MIFAVQPAAKHRVTTTVNTGNFVLYFVELVPTMFNTQKSVILFKVTAHLIQSSGALICRKTPADTSNSEEGSYSVWLQSHTR